MEIHLKPRRNRNIHISDELWAAVKRRSKRANRSMNNYVESAILAMFKTEERGPSKPLTLVQIRKAEQKLEDDRKAEAEAKDAAALESLMIKLQVLDEQD